MSDNRETNGLLREIRDNLVDREEQYARHLEQIRELYSDQISFTKQEQERAVRRLALVIAVLVGVAFVVFKLT